MIGDLVEERFWSLANPILDLRSSPLSNILPDQIFSFIQYFTKPQESDLV